MSDCTVRLFCSGINAFPVIILHPVLTVVSETDFLNPETPRRSRLLLAGLRPARYSEGTAIPRYPRLAARFGRFAPCSACVAGLLRECLALSVCRKTCLQAARKSPIFAGRQGRGLVGRSRVLLKCKPQTDHINRTFYKIRQQPAYCRFKVHASIATLDER